MRGRSLRGPAAVHRPRNAAHLIGRWRAEEDHQLAQLSSDWLTEPSHYAIPQYVADCVTLIARLDVPTMAWVGTSMGGLIGMALAAFEKTPIRPSRAS